MWKVRSTFVKVDAFIRDVKAQKINLIPEKHFVALSPHNIHILCESIHDKNNSSTKYIDVRINPKKKNAAGV